METQELRKVYLLFIMIAFFAMRSVCFSAEPATPATAKKDVKQKMTETVQAIEKYSIAQRDEAVKKAKAALDDLDARIDSLEARLNKQWDKMDQAARNKAWDALRELRKQRNELAEWFGGLKHGSGKAWEGIKKSFLKNYQRLRETLDKAHRELEKE